MTDILAVCDRVAVLYEGSKVVELRVPPRQWRKSSRLHRHRSRRRKNPPHRLTSPRIQKMANQTSELTGAGQVADASGRRGYRELMTQLPGRILRNRDLPVFLVLVAIVGTVSIFHPNYLSTSSMINTARFAAYIGCMAIGTVFALDARD